MRAVRRLIGDGMAGWANGIRGFWADRRGSTISMMAVGLIPAIAALGGAIDAGRMYIVKSQLQTGVDAAALAGARAFGITGTGPTSRTSQVATYFDGNFSRTPAYMGTTAITLAPTFATVNGINVTTVTARAKVQMSFMKIFGMTDRTLSATAKAELQPRPLEVMMVLDNTGSMRFSLTGGKTRITALKEAANSFVDILFQGGTQRRDLALGFVPYDVTVNVGNLLQSRRPGSVAAVDGFNAGLVGNWPANPYAWKGCVMNDATVRDVSTDQTVSESGAWDVTRTLPGESGNPAVQPFFVPPMYVPDLTPAQATAAEMANRDSRYYVLEGGTNPRTGSEQKNNLYRLDSAGFGASNADYLVKTDLYRPYFYDYYVGLNNGDTTAGDDVIRRRNGDYYNPTSGNRTSNNWYVDWTRIPHYNESLYWSAPATAEINANGGRYDDLWQDRTPMPSPNWQCPEEAMLPLYNRLKSTYTDYIRDDNAALYPGNGTIHHSGLLWGYRLLVRDDVFTRPRPVTISNETARRAIVFMTDGLNEVDEDQNGWLNRTFTWYGRWSEGSISAAAGDAETQMLRRFAKTCANIQRETNAPEVYIVALVANSTAVNQAFDQCAPGRVYRTSSSTELNTAFQAIASELVDLHLVQ